MPTPIVRLTDAIPDAVEHLYADTQNGQHMLGFDLEDLAAPAWHQGNHGVALEAACAAVANAVANTQHAAHGFPFDDVNGDGKRPEDQAAYQRRTADELREALWRLVHGPTGLACHECIQSGKPVSVIPSASRCAVHAPPVIRDTPEPVDPYEIVGAAIGWLTSHGRHYCLAGEGFTASWRAATDLLVALGVGVADPSDTFTRTDAVLSRRLKETTP